MTIAGSKLASPAFTAEGAGITEFIIISHKMVRKQILNRVYRDNARSNIMKVFYKMLLEQQ